MSTQESEDFDVIVVGGGPAGSTAATLVAKSGYRVVLLEKETFPRYQIGESLLPATVHGICRLLGVSQEIENAGFMLKRGGSFRWGTNPQPWNFLFALSPELSGPTSFAYQVERMKFDDILLKNASKVGVDVRENVAVGDVIADEERVRGIRYTDSSGRERVITARYLLDASGNGSRIRRHVGGTRHYSEFFKNVAIFGYFEGGKRLPGPDAGNILCAAFSEGWIWYIPLSKELTSVGAVVSRAQADKLQGDREEVLLGFINSCTIVRDMLSEARRVTTGTYGEIRTRQDYSYSNSTFWRPGMALIGDAACFIDPVFSTGVHLATYAGLLAARSINSVLSGGLDERRAFEEFEGRYRREYGVFYEFLSAFYDMQSNENSYFWNAKKVTNFTSTDMEAFVTLVGGVASKETALTNPEALVERFSASSKALNTAAERTGTMQTTSGERMSHLFRAQVVSDVMREMNQIQMRGVLGAQTPESPLLTGGLISSMDGLSWAESAR